MPTPNFMVMETAEALYQEKSTLSSVHEKEKEKEMFSSGNKHFSKIEG